MIVVERFVCVSDTDCTKALYFTSLLKFIQEGFEELLRDKYTDVSRLFLKENIAFPIVHVEADFFSPIFIGQNVKIHINLDFGKTSFSVKGEVFHEEKLKGKAVIKHVCFDPKLLKLVLCKELFRDL